MLQLSCGDYVKLNSEVGVVQRVGEKTVVFGNASPYCVTIKWLDSILADSHNTITRAGDYGTPLKKISREEASQFIRNSHIVNY